MALRVHTHVREDALQLFGFLTDLERQLFERLIGISGIGPKLALAVLSGMEPRDLRARRAARRRRAAHRHSRRRQEDRRAHRARAEGSRSRSSVVPGRRDGAAGVAGAIGCATTCSRRSQNLGYHRPLAEKAVDAALDAPTPTPHASSARFAGALKRADARDR